jgi:hypothetical protein
MFHILYICGTPPGLWKKAQSLPGGSAFQRLLGAILPHKGRTWQVASAYSYKTVIKRLDININIDTIKNMAEIKDILVQMKHNPMNVRFADVSKVCRHYFGMARHKDGSHHVYKTPWQGDPRINIQTHKGKAKAYQVKQVLLAIEKLEVEHATEE